MLPTESLGMGLHLYERESHAGSKARLFSIDPVIVVRVDETLRLRDEVEIRIQNTNRMAASRKFLQNLDQSWLRLVAG